MAESISSLIREYGLKRKERRKRQYAGYWTGQKMLIAGEKKKKQEAETKEAYNNIYLYKNLGKMPDIPINSYASDISMKEARKRTYQEMLGYGVKFPEGKQWYEFTPEEWGKIESDYYSKRPELKETQVEENYKKRYEFEKKLKKPVGMTSTKVPTEPFTKRTWKKDTIPDWDKLFFVPLTDKEEKKMNEIFMKGGTITPGAVYKTIEDWDKNQKGIETIQKEYGELRQVREGLKNYKVTEKDGKMTKISVRIEGVWKNYYEEDIKKALDPDEPYEDSKNLKNLIHIIGNYKKLKKREKELGMTSLPLDTETGEGLVFPEFKNPKQKNKPKEKKYSDNLQSLLEGLK